MRQDSHHIQIKNLRTGQKEGFMLTAWDKPFTVQWVDTIATRISEWEILYTDFTNSRVFAQSDWSGGISKYWVPERIYSTIYPTLRYADSYNAKVSVEGEFTIGSSVILAENFPDPTTQFSCSCNGETLGIVYAGVKWILKVYKSTDHGITWSEFIDLTGDSRFTWCDEIADIKYFTTNYIVPWFTSEIGGKNEKQLWFIAYNNSADTCVYARKDIYTTRRTVDKSFGRYFSWTELTVTKAINYGNTNIISFDTTVDINTHSLNIVWNSDVTNGYARIASWAPTTWYPTNQLEIYEGSIWNPYEIALGWDGSISFIWYSWIKVNGSFNCRIAQNTHRMSFKATMDAIIFSFSWNLAGTGYGRMFQYWGEHYGITGVVDNHAITDIAWQITASTGGFSTVKHYANVDLFSLYNSTGNMISLLNTGIITIDLSEYIYTMTDATSFGKKLLLLQSPTWEELYVLSNNNEKVQILWNQSAWATQDNYTDDNIHGFACLRQWWNPLKAIFNEEHLIDLPIGYYPTSWTSKPDGNGFIGSQLGTTDTGVQAKLFSLTPDQTNATEPDLVELITLGEQAISAMIWDFDMLWIATNTDGNVYIYEGTTILFITRLPIITWQKNYIDSIVSYAGKIMMSYQKWPWVYVLDPNTFNINANPVITADILCTIPDKTADESFRITNLLSTWVNLLIGTNDPEELFYYNKNNIGEKCYVTSSIYGSYISNVEKNWLYAYLRTSNWLSDDGQKVRMQVSFDEWQTWLWMPIKKRLNLEITPSDFTDYEHWYDAATRNDQWLFFFPTDILSNTIQYRAWLYRGNTYAPVCTHISFQYIINYKQELLFNYNIVLAPNLETLDGRHVDKRKTQDKVKFLKEIWQSQDIVEFTHIDWIVYTGISFSDDRTPGQWIVIQAQNANAAAKDYENIAYNILLTLKTIANFTEIL